MAGDKKLRVLPSMTQMLILDALLRGPYQPPTCVEGALTPLSGTRSSASFIMEPTFCRSKEGYHDGYPSYPELRPLSRVSAQM